MLCDRRVRVVQVPADRPLFPILPAQEAGKTGKEILIYLRYPGRRSFLACPGLLSCRPCGTSDRLRGRARASGPCLWRLRTIARGSKTESMFFSFAKTAHKTHKTTRPRPRIDNVKEKPVSKTAQKDAINAKMGKKLPGSRLGTEVEPRMQQDAAPYCLPGILILVFRISAEGPPTRV